MEEEGVAERALCELPEGHGVDGSTEHGEEKILHRRSVQWTELDPGGAVVLPEHDHGVGAGLGAERRREHAGEHGGRASDHDLMDQGGRAVVEEVRVIDEEQQWPRPGIVEELVHIAAELIGVRFRAHQVRVAVEERRKCSEGIASGDLGA